MISDECIEAAAQRGWRLEWVREVVAEADQLASQYRILGSIHPPEDADGVSAMVEAMVEAERWTHISILAKLAAATTDPVDIEAELRWQLGQVRRVPLARGREHADDH